MRTKSLAIALLLTLTMACHTQQHDPPQPVPPVDPADPADPTVPAEPVAPQIPVPSVDAFWPAEIQVPETWTCGDLPPVGERIIIAVDAAGAISVDDIAMDWEEMNELLTNKAEAYRRDNGASALHAVLAVDASLPWAVAQHLAQACAAAWVVRLYFAVSPADGGEPGAFALYLPQDRGLAATITRVRDVPKRAVRVRDGWPPTDPMGLHDILNTDLREHPAIEFEVDAKAGARVGLVLRLFDIAATQGVTRAGIVGVPGRVGLDGLAPVVATHATPARKITVVGREMRGPPALIPVAARVHGAYAGFTERPPLSPEKEIEIEEPR